MPRQCWQRTWAPSAQTPGPAALMPWGSDSHCALPPRHGQLWALSFTSSGSQTPVLRRPRARHAPSWDRGMLNWQQTGCDGSQLDPHRSAAQPGLATSSSLHTAQNPVFKAQVHPCVLLTPQWSLCTDIAFPPTADSWQIF